MLLHQAAEAEQALQGLEATEAHQAVEDNEVKGVAQLEAAVREGLHTALAIEEQVARLLLYPHALGALERHQGRGPFLGGGGELEDQAQDAGHVLVVELLRGLAINHVALHALGKEGKAQGVGLVFLVFSFDAARHAHLLAAVEEVQPRHAYAVRVCEHLLDALVEHALEVVLVAHLAKPKVDAAALEETLVDEAVLARDGAALLHPSELEGPRRILGVEQGVHGGVLPHPGLCHSIHRPHKLLFHKPEVTQHPRPPSQKISASQYTLQPSTSTQLRSPSPQPHASLRAG